MKNNILISKSIRLLCLAIAVCFVFSGVAMSSLTARASSINGVKLYTRKDTNTRTMENDLVFSQTPTDKESRFTMPGYIGQFKEQIQYSTKTLEGNSVYDLPYYDRLPDSMGNYVTFSGGTAAAGNIMAWYNGMVEGADLIPGHEIWRYFLGGKSWGTETLALHDAFLQLRDDMQSYDGVTINNYFNGLDQYVTRRGRHLADNTNLLQQGGALGGIINKDLLDDAFDNGRLVTAFIDGFTNGHVINISDGVDETGGETYEGLFAIAIQAYTVHTYYDEQGKQFRQDVCFKTRIDGTESWISATSHTVLKGLYVTQIIS
ncbi:MAG: hypothetical protein FWF56_05620 [Firmicutes bacterium]|nr:hypothetical protein [Bacillota bacterium]MCL1953713.1 hypothetical protein [Bacillota bacterium]